MNLYNLTKKEKDWIFDRQQELFDSGFAKDKALIQKECYNEAVKEFFNNNKKEINDDRDDGGKPIEPFKYKKKRGRPRKNI